MEAETKTTSGILLTTASVEKPKLATVINVGENVTGFHPDDQIIYKSYSTTDIQLNREEFFLVAEEDVLGVVVETEQ
jgi:chaperonin GroES